MSFFAEYSYLFAALFGLVPVVAAYVVSTGQRRMMLVSALTAVAISPSAIVYEGEYWNPVRLGGWNYGIEDVICCFSFGSLLWLAAVLPIHDTLRIGLRRKSFVLRFVVVLLIYNVAWTVFWQAGISACTAAILVQSMLTVAILLWQAKLWPLPVCAIVVYVPYYCLILFAVSCFIPGFFDNWNGDRLSGIAVQGLPIEDLLWIISFAGIWPLFVAFLADVRVAATPSQTGR